MTEKKNEEEGSNDSGAWVSSRSACQHLYAPSMIPLGVGIGTGMSKGIMAKLSPLGTPMGQFKSNARIRPSTT